MNESTITLIAEAVLSNTRIIEKLIDSLPVEMKQAVEAKVTAPKAESAPVTKAQSLEATPVAPVAFAQAPTPAPAAPAPVMPAPPTFVAPAPAAPQPTVPFSDAKGLITYVMGAYQVLGPEKGAAIQGVLTSIGVANINDVPADKYAILYAGIEALKG